MSPGINVYRYNVQKPILAGCDLNGVWVGFKFWRQVDNLDSKAGELRY